ncbi:MAG: LuxR C-terminal-related transcriptional regulator [Dehalococcoidales bacterium]
MTAWLFAHWVNLIIPIFTFITVIVFSLWSRLAIYKAVNRQSQKVNWFGNIFNIKDIWNQFLIWFILLGAFFAVQISILPPLGKKLTEEGLGSVLVLSLTWTAITISVNLLRFYLNKHKMAQPLTAAVANTIKILIIAVSILITLEIWGVPTLPIVIVLIAGVFILIFVFRHTLDNLLAGFEIAYGEHIKVGDLIKLESGESGCIKQISLIQTIIQTEENNLVIIPNHKVITHIIVNRNTSAANSNPAEIPATLGNLKLPKPDSILSSRELEVLSLIGHGATNREIAQKLIISEHTVKSHLRSILSKLNIRNRQQAAAYAEHEGLISYVDTAVNNR